MAGPYDMMECQLGVSHVLSCWDSVIALGCLVPDNGAAQDAEVREKAPWTCVPEVLNQASQPLSASIQEPDFLISCLHWTDLDAW